MKSDLAPVFALAERYKLSLQVQPAQGLSGDHLSQNVGSSVEFHDFRRYVPGEQRASLETLDLETSPRFGIHNYLPFDVEDSKR